MENNIIGYILNSKAFGFIFATLAKLRWVLATSCLLVVYWVFSGLNQIGFIDKFISLTEQSFKDIILVAKNCTPQIGNFQVYFECLKNPEEYEVEIPEKDKKSLQEIQEKIEQKRKFRSNNPYKFYELANPYNTNPMTDYYLNKSRQYQDNSGSEYDSQSDGSYYDSEEDSDEDD